MDGENNGTIPIKMGWFWGTPIFGNTQVCPKDAGFFVPTNPMTWGWDWDHQSYLTVEGSGFLGCRINKIMGGFWNVTSTSSWNVTSTPSHPRATAAPLSTLFTILVKPTMHAGNSPEQNIWQITRYWGFLKWCYPTTMGFPTKNHHFGVFWGVSLFLETPIYTPRN